ncbi:3-ketoacyl-ACP reductase [Paracoccus aerodenitrificans]|uniref:3-ketoacyl-ACP reductase n=1 Tax=Paracoccus aerodenitrificans TaxID=3017781 RepID=UPI0022EFFFB9|nr:3-ketoacyl-ACP reductase [Paracoccus aerodenitrificans]WBU65298.1 3-ketoacyl-ACP reductase [Paracoccus aerodenitrificans]
MSGVALITGGQQGIGLGIATALRDAGWRLAIAAEQPPEAVRDAMSALPEARYYQHDLAEIDTISSLLDAVEADLGPVTALICNAGVPARIRGDMLEMLPENFDWTMNINLRGNFFLAQQVARRMLARPGGEYRAIIFVTSVSAEMVSVERAEYCMSKAGASMMAKLFAARLAGDNIGVFELRPGIVETPMTAAVSGKYDALIAGGLVPAGRWGKPADIGRVVLPLLRGEMAFSTGSVIAVDGGLSIPRL